MARLKQYGHHPPSLQIKHTTRNKYWRCVYHWNDRKGVIIGDEPPNDTWPTHNR
ncbi:hypothetical protein [Endozoicomonas elysicola]|uniref:hypothetical protein n=1 Tax=Endozoicomonas elysicola TaxID=305900 RepID=UPI0012F96329|nr:hypothetical protein [Endozoicomonas elysicola]